ncbi:BPSS1780 family membrane protein [Denitromonas iodatirespirans]|uniref:Transmembrane protein n=1 Tax=Denitromonas iodatirespirans TaxID=2795389 RepID=A0A944D828_DENI1|nr:BPSS1780 family membrane protein [Denitromonas iodatirespirans]MBT0961815.1 hypothetical protein [Denitromonas iodatirespirans]
MQAYKRNPTRGFAWLVDGFRLWKRSPALVTYLTFGYLLILVLLSVIPLIGQAVASLILPIISLGVLNGMLAIHEGRKAGPEVLLSGFKSNVGGLVTVGGLYLTGTLLALAATALIDGGALLRIMVGNQALDEATMATPGLMGASLFGTLLTTPLMMAYWFAAMLVGWCGLSAPKAMFFSLIACWRSFGAFSLYVLGIFFLVLGGPALLISVIAQGSPALASLLTVPLPLITIPIVFASFLPNALDIFGQDVPHTAHA